MPCAVRGHRCHELHDQSRGRDLPEGPGTEERRDRAGNEDLQPGFDLDPSERAVNAAAGVGQAVWAAHPSSGRAPGSKGCASSRCVRLPASGSTLRGRSSALSALRRHFKMKERARQTRPPLRSRSNTYPTSSSRPMKRIEAFALQMACALGPATASVRVWTSSARASGSMPTGCWR